MSQQFEWDAAKAITNVKDHRVTFEEALTVSGISWHVFSLIRTIPETRCGRSSSGIRRRHG